MEELPAEAQAAEQPTAVQAAVRAAVRESEERAEGRVKAIHEAYEKAAAEQQKQIKQLLKEANQRAQQQQEYAVSIAVAEALQAADEDKQVALQNARSAVHGATMQQQSQMDKVLAEMAELRAENLRMQSDLQMSGGGAGNEIMKKLTATTTTGEKGGEGNELADLALAAAGNGVGATNVETTPLERVAVSPGADDLEDEVPKGKGAAVKGPGGRALDLDWM